MWDWEGRWIEVEVDRIEGEVGQIVVGVVLPSGVAAPKKRFEECALRGGEVGASPAPAVMSADLLASEMLIEVSEASLLFSEDRLVDVFDLFVYMHLKSILTLVSFVRRKICWIKSRQGAFYLSSVHC